MKKGTIVYIGGFELPDKNAAAHRVVGNGKALRELGYEVIFIGVNKSQSNTELTDGPDVFGFESYRRANPVSLIGWIKDLKNSGNYIKLIESFPNVRAVICYNLPSLLLYTIKSFGRKNKVQVYSDCTEWYDIKKKGNSFLKYLIRKLDVYLRMRIINPRLDGVIVISDFLYTYYSRKKINVIKVPPLVDLSDEKWISPLELNPGKVTEIFYAGTPFSLYKEPMYKDRLDLIIEALWNLKNQGFCFVMHIAGVQKFEVTNNFPQLASKIDELSNSLIFYGKIPHLQVLEKLKHCDFSLFIRYNSWAVRAGFPTKFVESISCSVPVLTNNHSNIHDFLVEGLNGYWLDISSLHLMSESLKIPLKAERLTIQHMKIECNRNRLFDYRNYIHEFQILLNYNG